MAGLIHFRCDNPRHAAEGESRGNLTIHLRTWAYCDARADAADHHWVAIAPSSVESLRSARVRERPGARSRR